MPFWQSFRLLCSIAFICTLQTVHAEQPALTPIADIRSFPLEREDVQPATVRLRGVIVWTDGYGSRTFAVGDDAASIYIEAFRGVETGLLKGGIESLKSLGMGQEIEIVGEVRTSGYAPVVRPASIRVLGEKPLPKPKSVTVTRLLSGRDDAQWVEVPGVVQSAMLDPSNKDRRLLRCSGSGGYFLVITPAKPWSDASRVVDARVKVRGLVLTTFNSRKENTGVRISVMREEDLIIEDAASDDPFDVPQATIGRLRPFSPGGISNRRRLVTGTVTYATPSTLYMQEGEAAVRVEGNKLGAFRVGDRVEVSAFVESRQAVASLYDAIARKIGHAEPPAPVATTVESILLNDKQHGWRGWKTLPADFSGKLVRMSGTLVAVPPEDSTSGADRSLIIQTASGANVEVRIASFFPVAKEALTVGAKLQLTGIADINYGPGSKIPELIEPESVRIRLRDANDIVMIAASEYWTARRVRYVLVGSGLVAFAFGVWTWILHRHLRRQALEVAEHRAIEAEYSAIMAERNRLAGELHDGLQQIIAGLSLQIESARHLLPEDVPASSSSLEVARQLVVRAREEMRRCIWALRELEDAHGDLTRGLENLLTTQRLCTDASLELSVNGPSPTNLPRLAMTSLLLIAQEAIANAVRHGNAGTITIAVDCTNSELTLTIQDDGKGFDTTQSRSLNDGHFGLQSMRDRLARIGGRLRIESEPGKGTRVIATLPKDVYHTKTPLETKPSDKAVLNLTAASQRLPET